MKNVLIILILLVSFISGCCVNGDCIEEDTTETEKFAKFLTEEGIAMAGLETCPHCIEQKEKFGSAFEHVNYHDCAIDQDWCANKGITNVPAWVFPDGNVYVGTKTIAELKELSMYYEKT